MKPKRRSPHKTRYVAFVAATADGRISLAKKTAPSWTSREDWKFFQDSLSRVDAVLVGRNTYEAAFARLRRRNTYVLSSGPRATLRRGSVTFVDPARAVLADLLSRYKTVAVLGGAEAYGTMLKLGLMDEIYITIEPLLFGRGREMIAGLSKTTRLSLLSTRRLNSKGTLLLRYRVEH